MRPSLARRIFLFPVKLYQKFISPVLGANCIYQPTCSSYFTSCVEQFGIIRGTVLGVARLLRCSRLFLGGPDEVPTYFTFKDIKDPYIRFRRH